MFTSVIQYTPFRHHLCLVAIDEMHLCAQISLVRSELGFKAMPEEPCLWNNSKIILLFSFADDIVLLTRKESRPEMEALNTKFAI